MSAALPLAAGAASYMATKIAEQLTPMFAGEIWESDADVPMGKGYANDGKPFDIETALYLRAVFIAIKNPGVRKIVIRAGVQTLKTYVVERSTAYFARHDPGDMTFYDCDQEAAKDHAKSRVGPLLKSIPGLAAQFAEVEADNRHDITTTEFYLPGMTLRFWPLNESSTQRITLRYVFISDAFLSKNTGMLKQAIARTTQHPLDKKIIIESQGSDEGDDFDREFAETDQGELWVTCPHCGIAQAFVWETQREDGSHAGMKRGPDELVKLEDGNYNAQEILKETHYECLHCRAVWHDTPEIRDALDRSAHFIAANPSANPEYAGFSWPAWINRRLRWGDIMLEYLTAKRTAAEFGNHDPLKQWYQKRAARTWSDKRAGSPARIISASFNIEGGIPDEVCRVMGVDAQQDDALTAAAGSPKTGCFWYVVRAIDKFGNLYQLDRGYATSWAELIAIQDQHKITNENTGIDCSFFRNDIIEMAAAKIREYPRRGKRHGKWRDESIWFTWTLLAGDTTGKNSWKWHDGKHRVMSEMQPQFRRVTLKGQPVEIKVPLYNWSQLSIKDQLHALVTGGGQTVKFLSLSRAQLSEATRLKEQGNLTYENQMSAEYRTAKKNTNKPYWDKARPANHYWDAECECLVLFGLGGYLGVAAPESEPDGQE
jgi:hypothetical protein